MKPLQTDDLPKGDINISQVRIAAEIVALLVVAGSIGILMVGVNEARWFFLVALTSGFFLAVALAVWHRPHPAPERPRNSLKESPNPNGTPEEGDLTEPPTTRGRLPLMSLLLLALALPGWGQTKLLRYPPCSVPAVELTTDTPTVKRGTYPAFTLTVRNGSTKPVHLIDVRQSRWQPFHAALTFLRGNKEVWLTTPISDPPPINPEGGDHFWLQPGGEERFKLHYEQDATELRAGKYEAVVVFWNYDLPPAAKSESCLSNRVQFTVK